MQDPKIRHLGTIAQLCQAVSSQLRHVSTIGKKLLNSNISPTCPHNMVNLRPTNCSDPFGSLGHPCKFQRVSLLGSATARHSRSGRQPNFVALNRRCHLYSAGRPSCWALAHVLFSSLWPPYGIGQAIIFLPCGFFFIYLVPSSIFFSLPNLSCRRMDVCHTSTHGVALVRI